jgi:hypothetical protein
MFKAIASVPGNGAKKLDVPGVYMLLTSNNTQFSRKRTTSSSITAIKSTGTVNYLEHTLNSILGFSNDLVTLFSVFGINWGGFNQVG